MVESPLSASASCTNMSDTNVPTGWSVSGRTATTAISPAATMTSATRTRPNRRRLARPCRPTDRGGTSAAAAPGAGSGSASGSRSLSGYGLGLDLDLGLGLGLLLRWLWLGLELRLGHGVLLGVLLGRRLHQAGHLRGDLLDGGVGEDVVARLELRHDVLARADQNVTDPLRHPFVALEAEHRLDQPRAQPTGECNGQGLRGRLRPAQRVGATAAVLPELLALDRDLARPGLRVDDEDPARPDHHVVQVGPMRARPRYVVQHRPPGTRPELVECAARSRPRPQRSSPTALRTASTPPSPAVEQPDQVQNPPP